jgi:thiazole/oxazole-forming peptide maturase SagD family component
MRYFNLAPFHDEPKLFHMAALFSEEQDDDALHRAGGSALSYSRAATKAVAEAAERRAARTQTSPVRRASFAELVAKGVDALDPTEFGLTEAPFVPSRDDVVAWVSGFRFRNAEAHPCLIPQQLVNLPYHPSSPEPLWMQITSNGLAAGHRLEAAIFSGLAEVAERHALFDAWLYGRSAARVEPPERGTDLSELLKVTRNYRLEPKFYRLPTPGRLATILCILRDLSGIGPWASLGLKTGVDEESTFLGALEEAHQLRPWLRELLLELEPAPDRLHTIQDRARWWLGKEAQSLTEDFEARASLENSPDERAPSCFGQTLEIFDNAGLDIYFALLTPPTAPVPVTRTVVPKLLQIYFDEDCRLEQDFAPPPLRMRHPLL